MKVNKIWPILEPTINRLIDMQKSLIVSQMLGDYELYKIMNKQYVEYGVKHFGLLKEIHYPKISIPLFSKIGMNITKIAILNLFRKKSPAEKEFAKLWKAEKLRKKFKLDSIV